MHTGIGSVIIMNLDLDYLINKNVKDDIAGCNIVLVCVYMYGFCKTAD